MSCALIELSDFDILSVDGPDRKKFLQGQVSSNTEELSNKQSQIGAICNIKGRVVADFRLLEIEQTCYLLLSSGMAAKIKSVLDKYIVFSKATTAIVTNRFRRYGLIVNDADVLTEGLLDYLPSADGEVVIRKNYIIIRISGLIPRFEIWHDQYNCADDENLIEKFSEHSTWADKQRWELEDIRAGIAHVTLESSEEYLPETLNYDISGVINFKKGCYTGQEIVARMYYRGVAKRRLFHGQCRGLTEHPESVGSLSGDEMLSNEFLNFVDTENHDRHMLLVLPATAITDDTELYVNGKSEFRLELIALPYFK